MALSSKTALSLALATHELATNAVKHGAWSTAQGKVSVAWAVEEAEGGRRLALAVAGERRAARVAAGAASAPG